MESIAAFIPMDRRQALAKGETLPAWAQGTVLFADISGYTPLTKTLMNKLGPKRGAELLTQQINQVFELLITAVHQYRGSIIGFSGDAITCWFDGDAGQGATACALRMQRDMQPFAEFNLLPDLAVSLAIKVAVVAGQVRRFQVGDPEIQLLDVIAGTTLDYMAAAEKQAAKGEVVVGVEVAATLEPDIEIAAWRTDDKDRKFAVVSELVESVKVRPWPVLNELLIQTYIRPRILRPVYEQLESGQDQFLGEFRQAVVLFLKFSGIAYDDDEAAEQKLDTYIRVVQTVLARHTGYLIKLTVGDKGSYLMATFGTPLAHGEEALQAAAAALELQSPSGCPPFISDVQIGLNQGWVLTGAFGSPVRRAYDILGDTANMAARLMSKATPGQILVSEPLAQIIARHFRCNRLGSVELKGSPQPVPIRELVGRAIPSSQRPASLFNTPLVGREHELAQMEQTLESIRLGRGQILRVEGEAGLGKSHLAAEFIERARAVGLRTVVGAAQSTSQDVAYAPWRQALLALLELEEGLLDQSGHQNQLLISRLHEIMGEINPEWLPRLPLLGALFNVSIDSQELPTYFTHEARQNALFALVTEVVQFWAKRQPLLLFIEDAHWLDEASQALLLHLSWVVAANPIVLLITHRPFSPKNKIRTELSRLTSHQLLSLSHLSPEGVMALAANRLKGQPSTLLSAVLHSWTQGNPFFVEELLIALRESKGIELAETGEWTLTATIFRKLQQARCLVRLGEHWMLKPGISLAGTDLGLPDQIRQLIQVRLDKLPPDQRMTMRMAGVIGAVFEFEVLAQAHPFQPSPETLLAQLNLLEARDFIRLESFTPQPVYMFRHHVTHEVAYETMLSEQQRDLHQRVAEVLAKIQPEAIERLAYHTYRSINRDALVTERQNELWDKAIAYLDQAAHKTQREYANEAALNYYTQALTLTERWEWRQGQLEVLHLLGDRTGEKALLNQLQAQVNTNPGRQATLDYRWGEYYEARDNYRRATAAIKRALRFYQKQVDNINIAQCLAFLGLIARRKGDYEQAEKWHSQALNLFLQTEQPSGQEAQILIQILNELGTAQRQQQKFDQSQIHYQQALTLSRQHGHRQSEAETLSNMGVSAYHQRGFAQASVYHEQALQIRRAIGDRAGEGVSLANLALVKRDAGDYEQAQQYFEKALTVQKTVGQRWHQINILLDLGGLYWELGDLNQAQGYLRQGLHLSQEIGDEVGQTLALCNLGLVYYEQGDLTAAENQLRLGLAQAQSQADQDLVSGFLTYLSLVNLQAGRCQEAVEQAQAALTIQRELEIIPRTIDNLAALAEAYQAINRMTEALEYAQQTFTLLEASAGEGPEFPQRDYFACYQIWQAAGQVEQAKIALQAAYNLVLNRADKITDPTKRRSFLEQKPVNCHIVTTYLKLTNPPGPSAASPPRAPSSRAIGQEM